MRMISHPRYIHTMQGTHFNSTNAKDKALIYTDMNITKWRDWQ